MGELSIALILAVMCVIALYLPAFDASRDRFLDAQVFWFAMFAGVIGSALAWSVGAIRKYIQSRGRR